VKVKAKDDPDGDGDFSDGIESDWLDPPSVSMPKNKAINIPFLQFLQNLLQNHPNIFPALQRLLALPIFNKILSLH